MPSARQAPGSLTTDFSELKERTRAVWSAGNYPEVAKLIESGARELVDACAISAGQEVLDVAAGTGNVALLAAREGARVVASDLTPALIDQGRARSGAEGVEIEWIEADAEDLPFDDGRFDCVTSSFGAMFAPRPPLVAAELFRVVVPGGTVGMANWTPDSFQGRMFAINNRYLPQPDGVPPATEWGDEAIVARRFDGLTASMELDRRRIRWEFQSSGAMRSWFEENAGPAVMARKALAEEMYEAMIDETFALVDDVNEADDGSVAFDGEYLVVVARKRG